jgi:hypothetical protein
MVSSLARLLASVVTCISARHSAAALLNSSDRTMNAPRIPLTAGGILIAQELTNREY